METRGAVAASQRGVASVAGPPRASDAGIVNELSDLSRYWPGKARNESRSRPGLARLGRGGPLDPAQPQPTLRDDPALDLARARRDPFGYAQDRPFGYAQDRPFGYAQDRPFGYAQDRRVADAREVRAAEAAAEAGVLRLLVIVREGARNIMSLLRSPRLYARDEARQPAVTAHTGRPARRRRGRRRASAGTPSRRWSASPCPRC